MRFFRIYIILLVYGTLIAGCSKVSFDKDRMIGKQDTNHGEFQKKPIEESAKDIGEPRLKDRNYYRAYNKTLAQWNTAFSEMHIQTSFGNAHVIASGPENGDALVLLHGMNASSTMWYPNIKALSQSYRVYTIDNMLEPGKSTMIGEVKDMDQLISWYNEIFDYLKLDYFTLIGASKGGWLAVKIALNQKSRISRLVLLSPLQTFIRIPPGSEISNTLTFAIIPNRKRLHRTLETMSVNVGNIKQSYIDQFYIASKKARHDRLLFQFTPFTEDELKSIAAPVLVLIGDQDIINNEKSIERAKELLPVCETGIIEYAGHFLSMDQSEKVNARILKFLDENRD